MRQRPWTRLSLMRKLKLSQLAAFNAVLESGSLLRAANELNVTQPALTKTIHELEACMEGLLFERSNRGVKPTRLGALLGRHVSVLMADLRGLADDVNAFIEGSGGHVIVGTGIVAAARLLPRAIARLKSESPHVLVTVHESNTAQLFSALANGDVDLVVGPAPDAATLAAVPCSFEHHLLFSEPLCVVGGARHWQDAPPAMHLGELLELPWLLPPPQAPAHSAARSLFRSSGLAWPKDVVESLSILMSIGLMLDSPRIGLISRSAALQFVEAGTLRILDVAETENFGAVCYTVRAGHELPEAAVRLIECLRACVAETEPSHR